MELKNYEVQIINSDGTLDILDWYTNTNIETVQGIVKNHFKREFMFNELTTCDDIKYAHAHPLFDSDFEVYIVEEIH